MRPGPKVSICIPTYNGEKHLEECLESALMQSYTNIEILIVDDESTDSTPDIARAFSKKDSRVCFVKNEKNLGLVGNWNRCVRISTGEWIKFLFQDDILDPQCVEKMIDSVKHSDVFAICRRQILFDKEIADITRKNYESIPSLDVMFSGKTKVSPGTFIEAILSERRNFLGEPTSMLLRREVFNRFGYFNPNLVQLCDLEYWIKIGVNCGLVYVPETLATFRLHSASASTLNSNRRIFRSELLDGLVLLREFAFNPLFEPLRIAAKKRRPYRNFRLEFAKRSFWIRAVAKQSALNRDIPDPIPLEEWKKLASVYPEFENFWGHIPLKIRHWFETHLLWRFSS